MSAPSITVAICTRNRPELLRRLLGSLLPQLAPPHDLLVIDNAPSNSTTRDLVRSEFPAAVYVVEHAQGLDFARNRALRESSADVVAYIDDDAVAGPDWIAQTAAVFAESVAIVIVTGKVDALSLDSAGARLFEANGGFARGDRRIHLPPGAGSRPPGASRPLIAWSIAVGSGASLAIRRRTALDLGGFDEALDMGSVLPGGGDLDMLWRVLAAGYQVVYEPRVHARHDHRREWADAEHQIIEHNRALIAGLTKALATAPARYKASVGAFLLWRLVKPSVRLVKGTVGLDPLPASSLARLWIATWRGLGAYPKAVRLAAERARERDPA